MSKMISVIVPVYNVEKYIRECLDSILAQNLSSFELILVDDGSTDDSGKICDEYRQKDDRIRVFHKENGGLSSARNKGLDEAKGDYICFVDSDDTIRKDYLEKLYNALISNNAEMAFCDFESSRYTGRGNSNQAGYKMNREEAIKWLYDTRSREYVLMVVAWNKMYSGELFRNIRFPEGRIHEDEFVIGPVLSKCKTVSFVAEKLYRYRDNEFGITSDANRLTIAHIDGIDALKDRIDQAIDEGNSEFAKVTYKNALYKCARFYGEAIEAENDDMKSVAMDKYREIYDGFSDLFVLRQRIKYRLFLFAPRAFIGWFNP